MLSFLRKKKKVEIKRLASKEVTDVLIDAMEHADDMAVVCVIYENKEECESAGGMFMQSDTTLSHVNWMIDQAKRWLVG